jgi:hypothetical protein
LQRGLPPVPWRKFSRSMLLPVLQLVLLWHTDAMIECHGDVWAITNLLLVVFEAIGLTSARTLCKNERLKMGRPK